MTIWIIGAVAREVTVLATLEAETLRVGSVDVHGVRVTLSRCSWYWGLVMILRARGVSLEETTTRWSGRTRIRVVGGREVDTRCRGGWFRVVGLLVDLGLLLALSTIPPLSVKLDGLILPDLERGWDWVYHVDAFFDSFDETFLEHLVKGDVVMATKTLIFFEVLNILFSGVSGHGDILEFGSSGGGRV